MHVIVGIDKRTFPRRLISAADGSPTTPFMAGDARLEGSMVRLLGSTVKADGGITESGEAAKVVARTTNFLVSSVCGKMLKRRVGRTDLPLNLGV